MRHIGRITSIARGTLELEGLSELAAAGDLVELRPRRGGPILGEVISLSPRSVTVLPEGTDDGLAIGDRAVLLGPGDIAPDDNWIGRVIDPLGQPLDGHHLLRGPQPRPMRGTPVNPTARRALGERLETGLAVFKTLLPIVRGQRIGLFAGSGVGKSTLLSMLAQGLDAEVVVIALVGERGREVREFIEHVLGP